ncbi:Pumilio, RNA binding domain [Sesbania bispinosa]|nr:Pumilio, RNA binding domain [Sesbania bispinosa]
MFKLPDDKEELGAWLNTIPNLDSSLSFFDLHPGNMVPLTSKSSPNSSSLSNGLRFCGDGMVYSEDDNWVNMNVNDYDYVKDYVDDRLRLSRDFSGLSILDEQGSNNNNGAKINYPMSFLDAHVHNGVSDEMGQQRTFNHNVGTPKSSWGVSVNSPGLVTDVKWGLPASAKGNIFGTPMESSFGNGYGHSQPQKPASFVSPYPCERFVCTPRRVYGIESGPGWGSAATNTPFLLSQTMQQPKHVRGDPLAFRCDNSFIIQERDMKRFSDNGCNSSMWGGRKYHYNREVGIPVLGEEIPQLVSRVPFRHENSSTLASDVPQPSQLNFGSLGDMQGYMYPLAKDQNGCRFLQKMVDEGTSEDMQIVFNGVIDNVVELMMDPFGNYLVQKLLDVCREEQRLQIVLMLTKEPGQLVRTSLNTHGTRVVQKLIGTLNCREQISLVRSAIQPGFLDLIKDLNGNHVIQRCLQCLSCQDNEFIFDAAAKFCVEIATHQHGCCVLQRCIDYSTGKCQDKLVKEICKHGLLLAQDPFGNYVVQYIIEMENPSASAKLLSQFKGNYVNLSTQKFSSHVVEKCLKHIGESRSRIVQELLALSNFEQLLQDPYANYGALHASLVEAVRPHKMLRTSPYCKRIFSRNLLKK